VVFVATPAVNVERQAVGSPGAAETAATERGGRQAFGGGGSVLSEVKEVEVGMGVGYRNLVEKS
jgi:hypothetical protein